MIVSIKSFSSGHIDCLIQEAGTSWRFTGFYGQPDVALQRFSWDLLLRLKGIPKLREVPWLVGEDFNEICFDSEKFEGNRIGPSQIQAFRDTLDICELQDLHWLGEFFTWVNRRDTSKLYLRG